MKGPLSAETAWPLARLKTIRRRLRRSRRLSLLWRFVFESASDPKTNLQTAARCVGMHPDHLNASLKKAAQVTFNELLSLHRTVRALRLLERSNDSLAKICHEAGFNSNATFWRHFRRHFGCPPSEWRARLLQQERAMAALPDPKTHASQRKSRKMKRHFLYCLSTVLVRLDALLVDIRVRCCCFGSRC